MWIAGLYIPVSREILYGIGFLLFLSAIVIAIVMIKRKRDGGAKFSTSRVFKGRNLERAGKSKKDLDVNYDDMPVVELKWEGGSQESSNLDYGNNNEDDDDEDNIDDGYTVVEKTIQEKAKQLPFIPPQKQSSKSSPSPVSSPKKEVKSVAKKDATGDKMDFFTTNKNAL